MKSAQLTCIVDDAADYRFILQQLFKRFLPDYPVRFFADGQAFLDELGHDSNSNDERWCLTPRDWRLLQIGG